MPYERVPVRDEYVEDDEMAVMTHDRRVLALSPLPSHLLRLLSDGPLARAEIEEALVERFGPPAPATSPAPALDELLAVMSDVGLIRDLTG